MVFPSLTNFEVDPMAVVLVVLSPWSQYWTWGEELVGVAKVTQVTTMGVSALPDGGEQGELGNDMTSRYVLG